MQNRKTIVLANIWKLQIHVLQMDACILWRRLLRHGKQKTVIVVPHNLRQKIISVTDGDIMTVHESKNKTKERIISYYWWTGIGTEINIRIKSCDKCQRTRKDKREIITFASPLPQCSEPNQRTDLFGPLKTMPPGKKFILWIKDAFSKYAELVTIPNKSAPTVASALFS
jgi:hypothetical protein